MSLNSFELSLEEAEEINKILPFPYQLEIEPNLSSESSKTLDKINSKSQNQNINKNKNNSKISTTFIKRKHKNEFSEKSKSVINPSKPNMNNNYNESEKKICENFYGYIENCEFCNIFYTQKYLDEPCLIDIENKLRSRKYHHLLDIVMDLRNLCLYYSDKKFSNKINYNAIELLNFVESTYKSFYNGINNEYKDALKTALKMDNKNNKIFSEKDLVIMAEQIKNLNPKHLIGLVKLIRAQYDQKNDDRYYEFDLNDLDMNTLNKINFYIKTVNK
jgi:hypothetical protein